MKIRCLLPVLTLFIGAVAATSGSFNDALLGPLSPSNVRFPFLQPTATNSPALLVYPDGSQVLQLQSDAQQTTSVDRREHFSKFDIFRRFLSDFLLLEYEQRERMTLPDEVQVRNQTYDFRALIVNEDDLDNLATMVERARSNGRNLPKAEIAAEIRTCLNEQFANAATNNFKNLGHGCREITRYRVNCRKIKDTAFVAIGTVHIIYQIARRSASAEIDENFIRDRFYEYSDYRLRNTVTENFQYPYMLESHGDYWRQSTTTASPVIPHRSLQPRFQRTVEGISKMFFDGAFAMGSEIVVKGKPVGSTDKFSVNLATGDGIILLHVAVRFDQNVVVRNTYHNKWQSEERDGGFFFKQNEAFEMKITSRDSNYEITINGRLFAIYNYRLHPSLVRTVWIYGDIENLVVADVVDVI